MSNKVRARLAQVAAGGAVVPLAGGDGMQLMYAGIIDELLQSMGVLRNGEVARLEDSVGQCARVALQATRVAV